MKNPLGFRRTGSGLALVTLISILSMAQDKFLDNRMDYAGRTYRPTIKDMFQMSIVGGGRISPGGDQVIYRLLQVDNFKDNRLEVSTYLYDSRTGQTRPLTNAGMNPEIRWIDNGTMALLKPVGNTGLQIHVFERPDGEGQPVTDHPGGIEAFEPFGNGFIYIAKKTSKRQAARESKYGSFVDVEEEESLSALYYVDRTRVLDAQRGSRSHGKERQRPSKSVIELSGLLKKPYKIESIVPQAGHDAVFVNCRSKDDGFYENDTSCFRIEIGPDPALKDEETAAPSGRATPIALPKGARIKAVSPDGTKLLVAHKEGGLGGHVQSDLWLVDLNLAGEALGSPDLQKQLLCLTRALDQEPLSVYWTKRGIFLSYWKGSTCQVARLDEGGKVEPWDIQGLSLEYFFVNDNAEIVLRAASPAKLAEIYFGIPAAKGWVLRRITNFNERFADWDFGTAESITWTSRDGTEIEGILRKPSHFDPKKKYPLLFNVHGGPAAVSPFVLLENSNRYFYPTVQFLNRDILVLEPNYRGSLGKGRSFQALNFDNLGIGDMWDLESAIDHLVALGFVDETRIGSMGWSQGGYISAFVAMHSTRLKAASAGAALSSWRTYFSGSDERQAILLSGDPYTNKDMFDKTAPMNAIAKAKTPILFQHGELDPRVPLISAMEMYRALKARGVEARLIVFPGKGHSFLKPRESYALMVQNFRWFAHYLLGEELDLLMDDTGETII